MSELRVVGKSITRLDAVEKVTGRAMYADDINLPGMLFGKILGSPYAHARIKRIDTSKAESLPRVKAIVTSQDALAVRDGRGIFDRYIPARDIVRFIGDPVAAVAAETVDIAEEFGIPVDRIRVVSGDTCIAPFDGGSVASRVTYHTGNAVRLACQDAKRQIL